MADVKLDAYGDTPPVSALTTELTGLAAGAWSAASSAIDNTSTLYPYMDLEFYLAGSSANLSTGAYASVYLLPSVDGTTYADGSSSVAAQPELMVATFTLRSGISSAQRAVATQVPLPPASFKLILFWYPGGTQTISANSTLKYRRYNLTVA